VKQKVILEAHLPYVKRDRQGFKNIVISHLPSILGSTCKNLHEAWSIELGLGCNKSIQQNNWKYSIRFEGIPDIELQSHTQERDGHMSQGQHLHKPHNTAQYPKSNAYEA
jgi:hypothetical protein